MARKKKVREDVPAMWLVTFSDLMTLLLTFFVLLLSMAVIDERSKLTVLGSISARFGHSTSMFNPLGSGDKINQRTPGPIEAPQDDLAVLRDSIIDDASKDLDFQENKYVQILSIQERALFEPGKADLLPQGKVLLDRFLPVIQQIEHPLLIAGHSAPRRDEEGHAYRVNYNDAALDSTWLLSFRRAMSIYRYFTENEIPAQKLSLEAFGSFHPRYSNNTPEGREKNRRVDLVLDKRNRDWIRKVEEYQRMNDTPKKNLKHIYRGFEFNLTMPGTSSGTPLGTSSGTSSGTTSYPSPAGGR